MKRLLLGACLLSAVPAAAQQARDFGAGVVLGQPIGASAKYWLDGARAVDLGLGSSGDFTAWADFVWHAWDVLPKPRKGRLAASLAFGGRVEASDDPDFGFRAMGGAGYWLQGYPIEVFAELGPRFEVDGDVGFDGGVGLRVYFKAFK